MEPALCYANSMSKLTVAAIRKKALERGITSALQLQQHVDLSYPTVLKWWKDDVEQIDPNSLVAFADFFECEPEDLIRRRL